MDQNLEPVPVKVEKQKSSKSGNTLKKAFFVLVFSLLFVILFLYYIASETLRNNSGSGETKDFDVVNTNPCSRAVNETAIENAEENAELYLQEFPFYSESNEGVYRVVEHRDDDGNVSKYSLIIYGVLTSFDQVDTITLYLPARDEVLRMSVGDTMLISSEAEQGIDRSGNENYRNIIINKYINETVVLTADIVGDSRLQVRTFGLP